MGPPTSPLARYNTDNHNATLTNCVSANIHHFGSLPSLHLANLPPFLVISILRTTWLLGLQWTQMHIGLDTDSDSESDSDYLTDSSSLSSSSTSTSLTSFTSFSSFSSPNTSPFTSPKLSSSVDSPVRPIARGLSLGVDVHASASGPSTASELPFPLPRPFPLHPYLNCLYRNLQPNKPKDKNSRPLPHHLPTLLGPPKRQRSLTTSIGQIHFDKRMLFNDGFWNKHKRCREIRRIFQREQLDLLREREGNADQGEGDDDHRAGNRDRGAWDAFLRSIN
ncbi:hypothetical protein D9758_008311 [Tetrapyrgos nigripes]|uniref:Uncharacterized protein n=1 Tax=Tetrapyrgos nigripes TaxID=182062 RepID=A0A8H5GE19_9AGAR|nr:hypothetical protein D9758_008311 [Tetrapyrgos nigripes]